MNWKDHQYVFCWLHGCVAAADDPEGIEAHQKRDHCQGAEKKMTFKEWELEQRKKRWIKRAEGARPS